MDGCVRCLRDGRAHDAAATALILESMETLGGGAVFDKVLEELVAAVSAGRSQARIVHVVAVDRPPSQLRAAGALSVTDCYSDPCGWLSQSSAMPDQVHWTDLQALQQLAHADAAGWSAATAASGPNSCCVVIAGLSTLLLRHPSMQVLQVLHSLVRCPQVSSLLLSLNTDLHAPQVVSALQALCSTTLQLQPLPSLQQQLVASAAGRACHGQLTCSSKRLRLGRLQVVQQVYALLPSGGVEVFAAPAGVALDARALVETALSLAPQQQQQQSAAMPAAAGSLQVAEAAAASAAGPVTDGLSKLLSSSMRLEVSEQERAAKAAVQLPFEHQGAGRTGEAADAREYLPPAAGGFGPGAQDAVGSGRLGHILYVRDSEEEHDSDEDPDDDLDI